MDLCILHYCLLLQLFIRLSLVWSLIRGMSRFFYHVSCTWKIEYVCTAHTSSTILYHLQNKLTFTSAEISWHHGRTCSQWRRKKKESNINTLFTSRTFVYFLNKNNVPFPLNVSCVNVWFALAYTVLVARNILWLCVTLSNCMYFWMYLLSVQR